MDNFHIDLVSYGDIEPALRIAFRNYKVVGYRVDQERGFIFYWNKSGSEITNFPFEMDVKSAAEFVTNWLKQTTYGPRPDHDGDNIRGWRIYVESWGHMNGEWQSICAIKPVWAMFGK